MIISSSCSVCAGIYQEGVDAGRYKAATIPDIRADLVGPGIMRATCSQGHERILVCDTTKYEVLFEIGLSAIYDGYYREAVLSFYGAAERFYEFWLRCVLRHRAVALEAINAATKEVRLSERQLGAFIGSYFAEYGRSPMLPKDEVWTKIRNEVAHQGVVPNRELAVEFGRTAHRLVNRLKNELLQAYPQAVAAELAEQTSRLMAEAGPDAQSQRYYSYINPHSITPDPSDFEALITGSWHTWRGVYHDNPGYELSYVEVEQPNVDRDG